MEAATQHSQMMTVEADGAIDIACRILKEGRLVAVPTETVYGLAADATNSAAVAAIFEAKKRPRFNPLILHVDTIERAKTLAAFGEIENRLARTFWPGPLTLVASVREDAGIAPIVTGGLSTVAVRCPRGVVRELVRRIDRPLAAPSANLSGRVSPTRAEQVAQSLGDRVALILDDGACETGLESTIVRVEAERLMLLRPGAVSRADLETVTGLPVVRVAGNTSIQAPGQMTSHYAPCGTVRLEARAVEPGEHLIAFGEPLPEGADHAGAIFQLSRTRDLREAAAKLFEALAAFDDPHIARIAVAPIPSDGLGEAINDRLRRAAAPRV